MKLLSLTLYLSLIGSAAYAAPAKPVAANLVFVSPVVVLLGAASLQQYRTPELARRPATLGQGPLSRSVTLLLHPLVSRRP